MPRRGLSRAALERVRETVAADARVVRVRPLRGGISSSVHVVHIATAEDRRQAVVVRRYGAYAQEHDPHACEREYRLLETLTRLRQRVPRPLLLDAQGGAFEAPTIVMGRIAGRPDLAPRRMDDYLRQMAEALLALHRLPVQEFAFLPDERVYVERALRPELTPRGDALQEAVWAAARARWPRIETRQRTLVHGDYWPGNLLWRRGQLVGIVDWEQSRLGDPTKDVATTRGDLSILFGLEAADVFVQAYVATGGGVDNLDFWDLLISTWAVREIDEWSTVYPLLGRHDVGQALARERIRAFATRALHATMGG
jgi:aminoglycoside phosphotransferase (APT) family kinase protein